MARRTRAAADAGQGMLFTPPLKRMLATTSVDFTRYSDGSGDVLFGRIYMEPFKVSSQHLLTVPALELLDMNRYEAFIAALAVGAGSEEVHDQLCACGQGGKHSATSRRAAMDDTPEV
jgi:hypothetical protein